MGGLSHGIPSVAVPRFGRFAAWLELTTDRFDGTTVEVAVYHNLDGEPKQEDTWRLMVRQRERRWLLPAERPVDDGTLQALAARFAGAGIESRRLEGDE